MKKVLLSVLLSVFIMIIVPILIVSFFELKNNALSTEPVTVSPANQ